MDCIHGWRGAGESDRIVDRCPACGAQSLFIGKGGFLTCAVIGCSQPGVGREIEKLLERARLVPAKRDCGSIDDVCLYKGDGICDRCETGAQLTAAEERVVELERETGERPHECEGCDADATTSDSEGVPLCQACFDALEEDEKKRCGFPTERGTCGLDVGHDGGCA